MALGLDRERIDCTRGRREGGGDGLASGQLGGEPRDRARRPRDARRRLSVLSRHAGLFGRGKAPGPFGGSPRLARRPWRSARLRRLDGRCGARARLSPGGRADVPDGDSAPGRPRPHGRDPGRRPPRCRQVHSHARPLSGGGGSFSALSPWAQKRLEAYAEGVNAFLRSHPLPPEFLLAGDRPEPWKPADSLVIAKIEAYQLSQNYKIKLLRARLSRKLGPERGKLAVSRRKARRSHHHPAGDRRHARKRRAHRRRARRPDRHRQGRVERVGHRRIANRRPESRSSPTTRISTSARRSSGIWPASSRPRGRSRARRCPARRSSCSARTSGSPGA